MSNNLEEVIAASRSIPPYELSMLDVCIICNRKIEMACFKGTGVCCDDCKKKANMDVGSVGTIMFVTSEEKEIIEEFRHA